MGSRAAPREPQRSLHSLPSLDSVLVSWREITRFDFSEPTRGWSGVRRSLRVGKEKLSF